MATAPLILALVRHASSPLRAFLLGLLSGIVYFAGTVYWTSGDGFVVQVAALRDRTEADALVRRLSGKGYSAFVVNPVPGRPPVYKVQVGRFADRGEAVRISARLKAEEQFSPWVTR